MTGPDPKLRWQALQIGPGGLPAEQVRPRGPGLPVDRSALPQQAPQLGQTPQFGRGDAGPPLHDSNKWGLAAAGAQPATSGVPSRAFVRVLVGLIAFGVVVALAFWANSNSPLTGAGTDASKITVGECLSSTGDRIAGQVACSSTAADFAVVGVSQKSSDAADCSASPSDVVVVASGPTVLCLDYVAAVGQCLYAGDQSSQVGKVDCTTADSGVLRVLAILPNSINPAGCPSDTTQPLIHRYNSQVVCLGSN